MLRRLLDGEKYNLRGVKDERGLIKGKATIEFENGDTISGFFVNGLRHGDCRIETSRQEMLVTLKSSTVGAA
jgi:hypothetical protein